MNKIFVLFIAALFFIGCGGGDSGQSSETPVAAGAQVNYEKPAPLDIPAPKEVASDTDWEAKVHNKEIEVLQVINIINPIAAFITAGFEQYGSQISDKTVHEEWADTQIQLTQALTLYDSCKKRKEKGEFDKKLFLDMENTWQMLVKTGVAGVRTNQMLTAELAKL